MSLSPVSHDEAAAMGVTLASTPTSPRLVSVTLGLERLLSSVSAKDIRTSFKTFASERGLTVCLFDVCAWVDLCEDRLYVCELGAFQYASGALISHSVWTTCVARLADRAHTLVGQGANAPIKGAPRLLVEKLVAAHTPLRTLVELDDIMAESNRPICGYTVDKELYAIATYSNYLYHCIDPRCRHVGGFADVKLWAAHYRSIKVNARTMHTFATADGGRVRVTHDTVRFGCARPHTSCIDQSMADDRDPRMAGWLRNGEKKLRLFRDSI
jgi:hypothetical protein